MTNRVHIDAPAGIVEIEGEKAFVEGVLDKFFPILEASKFGSRPAQVHSDAEIGPQSVAGTNSEDGEETQKLKIKRRRGSSPPKGQSCADRIQQLKAEKFFKTHRGPSEIVSGLAAKGWTHNSNQVSAALVKMFERGDIQRTKEAGGSWKYYWDRD